MSTGHWFTVRANFNRRIHLGGRLRPKRNQRDRSQRTYLRQYLRKQRILGEYSLDVPTITIGRGLERLVMAAEVLDLLGQQKKPQRKR